MIRGEGACLVCGKPLTYFETAQERACVFCRRSFDAYASCEEGHYVCDSCHAARGVEDIRTLCLRSRSQNPVEILMTIMDTPYVHMHGPEHHILVGSALLTAYHNAGGQIDLPAALQEMKNRGSKYPGGSCGFWGCCGAAVSTGMFLSIVNQTTPLAGKTWGQGNRMTAAALQAIGDIGGPRCCKRNSFTAVREAVALVREELGVSMVLPEKIVCHYSGENHQCLGRNCPYHQEGMK